MGLIDVEICDFNQRGIGKIAKCDYDRRRVPHTENKMKPESRAPLGSTKKPELTTPPDTFHGILSKYQQEKK